MTRARIIFYSIFAAYQLAGFIFTLVIDSNFSVLMSLVGYVPYFKWVTFLGLVLVAIDFMLAFQQARRDNQQGAVSQKENNVLRAKIYDLQEIRKEVRSAGSK